MIIIPEKEPPPGALSFAESLWRALPRAYAILFFSGDSRFGWWLLAVSMLQPVTGLCGLFGIVVAAALAWWLGYDRMHLRTGFSLFNPMLTCLTVGWLHHCHSFPWPLLALLLTVAGVGGFFLSVGMNSWVGSHFGFSAHSLPSVVSSYALYLLSHALYGPAITPVQAPVAWIDMPFLPPFWSGLFAAFGSMAFQARPLPGVLAFLGLACTSPLTTLVATGAYAAGIAVLVQLGMAPEMAAWGIGGYNLLLCGIALGASYFITSGASLLLAALASAMCAFTGVALGAALQYFSLPPSALPYNLVLLVLLFALRQRGYARGLVPSPAPGALPEQAARQVMLQARRFPDLQKPALDLPFDGTRLVTQGFAGSLTHRGRWQHALDFESEVRGKRHTGDGSRLEDFHLFNTPVLSPCAGYVAYVENGVADNLPGQNNPDQNWGNCVILHSDAGFYVMVAHLKEGSVTTETGRRVRKGEEIGRCGNSGRSPVPHLHLQVQATGYFSAPTLPFCLKNFIEEGIDGGPRHRTSGVPVDGATVRPPLPNPALAELLRGLLPGEYRYRVTGHTGHSWEETVRLDFDDWGRYRFRSRRHGAQLSAFLDDGTFYATEYSGPARSVLALIATGLARVPCIADPDVFWSDCVSAEPFRFAAFRWILDLAEPFFGPFLLHYRYRLRPEPGGGFVIQASDRSQSRSANPREITCDLQPRRGVVRVEARLHNDHVISAVQTDFKPLTL